jgi:plasmid stabilization system protein ParE
MTFDFHPEALQEYRDSAAWYEEQRNWLGVEFTEAADSAIMTILQDPQRHQFLGAKMHVFRLKRFPFYLFYHYDESTAHVRIVALMHHKKRPDYWKERM